MSRTNLTKRSPKMLLFVCFFTLSLFSSSNVYSDCKWIVKGYLKAQINSSGVDTFIEDKLGYTDRIVPLKNVEIEVKSKTWGPYSGSGWKKVRTDDNGKFYISSNKSCSKRKIKVTAQFKDKRLRLQHEDSTKLFAKNSLRYEIYRTTKNPSKNSTATINLGDRIFKPGGSYDLGNHEAYTHAKIWFYAKLLMNKLNSWGESYRMGENRVEIKYPNDSTLGATISYANPQTHTIYIDKSKKNPSLNLIWHEMFHIWAYDRVKGELCLFWDLIADKDTHNYTNDPCVAFHEGFAEFSADQLQYEIFGSLTPKPLSRYGLKKAGINSIDKIDNLDKGYDSLFKSIVMNNIQYYDFNVDKKFVKDEQSSRENFTCNAWKDIPLKDFLKVFNKHYVDGYDSKIGETDYPYTAFLKRLEATNIGVNKNRIETVLHLQDPKESIDSLGLLNCSIASDEATKSPPHITVCNGKDCLKPKTELIEPHPAKIVVDKLKL